MNAQRALRRMVITVLLGMLVQTIASWHALAQTADTREQSFLLGTGSTEGTYHPVGVALSTLIKLKLLPDLNVDLTAINTGGSYENIELVRQDETQFAILSAISAYEAQQGIGRFSDIGPDENLKAITALWRSADHVIVRGDKVQSGTIDDFVQLRGQSVSMGRRNSGTLIGNRALMAPLGVDVDSDFNLVELGFEESADAMINGDIDAMSLAGGLPIGAVQRVFDALGNNAAVLEFNDEQLAYIDQGRRIWSRSVIPAQTYTGQERDIFTISTPNILAVRGDIDDEVVYQITKTIFENLEYLHGLHEATAQVSFDTAINNLPLPIHEGALRYFEEKGVELPAPPVDIDPNLLSRFDDTNQAREEANQGVLSMFTGADGDTSARVAAELANTLNVADDGFRVLPTFGGGSSQNLTDLLYLKGVDSALMRTDTIAYAAEQGVYPSLQDQIVYITEMFPEEVHLVVTEDIDNIRELEGKKVNIGASGSGGDITASIILSQLDIPVQAADFEPYAALDKLKSGELSGAFFVGGKPMPLLNEIDHNSGLTLLPIPFVQYADSYRSTAIKQGDYPNLWATAAEEDISTIAVRTALFTYAWRSGSPRYEALAKFSDVFFDHLSELHQEGRHPKWRQVDPTSEIVGLNRFDPARVWVENNFDTAQRIALEGRYLIEQTSSPAPAPVITPGGTANESEPVSAPLLLENQVPASPGSNPLPASEELEPTNPSIDDASAQGGGNPSPLPADGTAAEGQPVVRDNSRSLSPGSSIESLPAATVNAPTF